MGYRIEYGQSITKKQISTKGRKGKTGILLTAAILTVGILGASFYPQAFLPGDKAVTASALQTLVEDLKTGGSFSDAMTTFCITIVEHGAVGE